MRAHAHRGLLAVLLILAFAATAGCTRAPTGPDGGEDTVTDETPFGAVAIEVVGFDLPDGSSAETVDVTFVLDHLGFYHADLGEWVAALGEPATVGLTLTETLSDPWDLDVVALPAGDYTDLEALGSGATIDTGNGATTATTTAESCYAGGAFTVTEDDTVTITLILGGREAFENGGEWTFRPAFLGLLSDDEGDFGEPDCRAG